MMFCQRSRGWVRDEQDPKPEERWRVRVARVAPLGDAQEAASERVQVAPPGSVRAAPPGRVRVPRRRRSWTVLSFVYSKSTTRPHEHNT